MKIVLDYYGLKHMPFGKDIASENIFPSDQISNTSAMLKLGVADEDIILLTGPVGSGKSVTLRIFTAGLDLNKYVPIYLQGNNMNQVELYKFILQEMKIEAPRSRIKVKTLYFKTISEASKKPVVIIDDAQDMSEEALLSIKAMVNFNQDSASRICFILTGQPELRETISFSQFESLKQRIKLGVHLKGMGLEETCGYIDHSLKIAGRDTSLFSDSAKSEIFNRSEGISRQVNKLCYQAILSGAIQKCDIIDSKDLPFTE
jgi:type II secretory pathway predicted ATPase ExeA